MYRTASHRFVLDCIKSRANKKRRTIIGEWITQRQRIASHAINSGFALMSLNSLSQNQQIHMYMMCVIHMIDSMNFFRHIFFPENEIHNIPRNWFDNIYQNSSNILLLKINFSCKDQKIITKMIHTNSQIGYNNTNRFYNIFT